MHSETMPRCTETLEGLPYELSYIPDELKRRAKTELFEDEATRVQSLRELKSMLNDEPDLYWMDDELFLLSFLRARKLDVKRAFNLLKTFYIVRGKRMELFSNFDFKDVERSLAENCVGILPYRDSDGCVVVIIRTTTWNPHENTLADIMRTLTFALLHANLSPATQIAGFKGIVDFSGFSLKTLPHVTPTYLWLFVEALQNCFPGRFKAVHIVNEGYLWKYLWAVLKQFLSKKHKDRFYLHGKNVKKLHKYFSPSILPAEYEGDLPPFDNSEWAKKMCDKADYIIDVFSHGYKKDLKKERKLS